MITTDVGILKLVSLPVETKEQAKEIYRELKDNFPSSGALGLAAIQIEIPRKAFVILQNKRLRFLCNPRILYLGKKTRFSNEGCLSIPNVFNDSMRAVDITIEYYNQNLKRQEETFQGIEAVVIQHELDHCEGKLCTESFIKDGR